MKKLYVLYMHAWCMRRPEEDVESLGLELQMVLSFHISTENQSSAKAGNALSYQTICPVPLL